MRSGSDIRAFDSRDFVLLLLLALAFGAVSLRSMPLRYDHGNSGRYLLPVLQAVDSELFPQDPVVTSLGRFRSLFYDLLAGFFTATDLPPEALEPTLSFLYAGARVGTILLVLALVRALRGDYGAVLLMAAWCSFKKAPTVGGESLFGNVMTHGTVAFLTGSLALLALLRHRNLAFWILLSLTLFLHPLTGFHLAACLVPAHLLSRRRTRPADVLGGVFLAASVVVYAIAMAPPAMTAAEAEIFIATKGGIGHVSPLRPSIVDWLRFILPTVLILWAWRVHRREQGEDGEDLLAAGVLWGVVLGLVLSFAALGIASSRLIQFQPLRILGWVHLMSYLLLALTVGRALRHDATRGALLLAVFVYSLLPSLWQLAWIALALAAVIASGLPARHSRPRQAVDKVLPGAFAALVLAMVSGWLLREHVSLETLKNPWVPLSGLALLILSRRRDLPQARRTGAFVLVVAVAFAGSTAYWYRFYDSRVYPAWGTVFKDRVLADWTAIRRWIAVETPKRSRFVVASRHGSFRTRALRTALGEPMSALAWVDPILSEETLEQARQVKACRRQDLWDLDSLALLAARWQADFLLVEGETVVPRQPEIRIGAFQVFAVENLRAPELLE